MSENKEVRKEILKQLRDATGNENLELPGALEFSRKKDAVVINMNTDLVTANLQTDGAAFEGWALAIKRWVGEKERGLEVHLCWDPADEHDLDYQRFLYRVIRFDEAVDWFKVGYGCQMHLKASRVLKLDGTPKRVKHPFLVNVPGKRKDVSASKVRDPRKLKENQIEVLFYLYPQCLLDSVKWSGCVERQMPVGVFDGEINDAARVFPGAGGKVDLAAIHRSNGHVALFELKKPGNTKVGVISEILFYTHIVRDIQRNVFRYIPEDKREFEQCLYEADRVYGYVLGYEIHPLLDDPRVFKLLNSAFDKSLKIFGFIQYDEALGCKKVYPAR